MELQQLPMKLLKYLIEGAAIALAAFYIPGKKSDLKEVAMIALTGAVTFFILDMLAPSIGSSARMGAGFGIGAGQVGFEGMCGAIHEEKKEGMCGAPHGETMSY